MDKTSEIVPRRSLLGAFSRSQIASAVATVADFGLLTFLVEICHVWYVIATAAGALAGALTNFFMNRHWSFRASHAGVHGQALRYSIVSLGSLILNTSGVYLVTEFLHIHYFISVMAVSFIIGIVFNFPLQRSFVFK